MSLPTAIQGALRPALQITWYESGTSAPVDLTGATLSGLIQVGATVVPIVGALSVIDGPNGVFRWSLAAADVATAGMLQVQFIATFGTAPTPGKSFTAGWLVEPSLVAS
jgi:hypothetical protein